MIDDVEGAVGGREERTIKLRSALFGFGREQSICAKIYEEELMENCCLKTQYLSIRPNGECGNDKLLSKFQSLETFPCFINTS